MNPRIALITGGAGGLGWETAKRFASEGMRIVIADLNGPLAQESADKLLGAGHTGCQLDVSDERSVGAVFEQIERDVGPIAVLVNFAGVVGGPGNGVAPKLETTALDEWEKVFSINARGGFLCVRAMAYHRTRNPVKNARIILVSSTAAQVGGYQTSITYIASKGAVLSLAKGAARELAPLGITVNTIAPGPIDTAMLRLASEAKSPTEKYSALSRVPVGRIGQPEEIAAAASYLASEAAGFVTGSTLDVNGGMYMN